MNVKRRNITATSPKRSVSILLVPTDVSLAQTAPLGLPETPHHSDVLILMSVLKELPVGRKSAVSTVKEATGAGAGIVPLAMKATLGASVEVN